MEINDWNYILIDVEVNNFAHRKTFTNVDDVIDVQQLRKNMLFGNTIKIEEIISGWSSLCFNIFLDMIVINGKIIKTDESQSKLISPKCFSISKCRPRKKISLEFLFWPHGCDFVSDGLNKIVVSCDFTCHNRKLLPVVTHQDWQHGCNLVIKLRIKHLREDPSKYRDWVRCHKPHSPKCHVRPALDHVDLVDTKNEVYNLVFDLVGH